MELQDTCGAQTFTREGVMEEMNWRPDRVFGLSYAPAHEGRPPELILRVEPGVGEQAERMILERRLHSLDAYLEGVRDVWPLHQLSLFTDQMGRVFGFGSCGYVRETEAGSTYHLPLMRETLPQVALTLHIFVFALKCMVSDAVYSESKANRTQLLDLTTLCDNHAQAGYGHAVAGQVYPIFRSWLIRYAETLESTQGHVVAVEQAMSETYAAIAHPRAREFARDCRARINREGRFLLECPGNACDIAIYPESDYGSDEFPSKFGCHNLDAAEQQLTLLAGLAVLHDLAVEELG